MNTTKKSSSYNLNCRENSPSNNKMLSHKEINNRKIISSNRKKYNENNLLTSSKRSSDHSSLSSGYYSMLPSARERLEYKHHFKKSYDRLCEINNTVPRVKMTQDSVLEFYGDRIKSEDWMPIIKAIENDQTLEIIRIKSRQSDNVSDPAIYKSKFLNLLVTAIKKCLSYTKAIRILHLEALPLSTSNIRELFNGIQKNTSLECVEFPFCSFGNAGCNLLCQLLRYKTNIRTFDLTACGITSKGVDHITELIKIQRLMRYSNSWQHTLRYRHVNPGASNGLQNLVLNNNINIGDNGFALIVNSLLDDLWIKDVYCQNCGLTNASAEKALYLVNCNYFIRYIDIRRNPLIDTDLVIKLERLLNVNNFSVPPQKTWNSESNINVTELKIISNGSNNQNSKKKNSVRSNIMNKNNKIRSINESNSKHHHDANNKLQTYSNCSRSSSSKDTKSSKTVNARCNSSTIGENMLLIKVQNKSKGILRETKSRLMEEYSKRIELEKYCRQLETQLKERENCVVIEKAILRRLVSMLKEFSLTLSKMTTAEVSKDMKNGKHHNEITKTNLLNHKYKFEGKIEDFDDLLLSLKNNVRLEPEINLNKNKIKDPKLKAQEIFHRLLNGM